jgi:hypothetical protein
VTSNVNWIPPNQPYFKLNSNAFGLLVAFWEDPYEWGAIEHHNENLVCVYIGDGTNSQKWMYIVIFESWWRFTNNYQLSSTRILWWKKTIPL